MTLTNEAASVGQLELTLDDVSRAREDDGIAAHREWMQSEEAQAACRPRAEVAEVAEFLNAWLKERTGLRKFRVKGLHKARSELLWAVLAYNVKHWIPAGVEECARGRSAAGLRGLGAAKRS